MSYEEVQFEEKSVQLIPEDLELLSEYSWNMAGYTSRFGYFYLGNEKADVEGLTRWQAEHIFQIAPTPPGMEDVFPNIEKGNHISKEKRKEILKKNEAVGDEYLIRAVEEKELRYLSFYLHAYEHRLNAKVYFFLRRNCMDTYDPAQFLDMKLALQEVILKKLPTYDPSREAKFLTYIHQFIYDVFIIFRMQQECWQMKSLDTYKTTRRMAATYNANDQDVAKAIEIFCSETGYTPETAEVYLAEAIGIRARQTEVIVDRDDNDTAIVEDIIPDGMGSLPHIIHSNRFGKAIRQSFEKLPWLDQTILKVRNAICDNCGGVMPMKEQYSFREISLLNGTTTDKAGELAYHAAVDRLTAQLIEDEVIRIVDMKLKKAVRRKKKNAAAVYEYQADCDGEWGEIYFDFEKGRQKILWLADWDTTKSKIYAKRCLHLHIPKRKNPQSFPPVRSEFSGDFQLPHSLEQETFMRHTPLRRCKIQNTHPYSGGGYKFRKSLR